ncbi:MAG: VWA domain-containing protein [Aureliella sp.]
MTSIRLMGAWSPITTLVLSVLLAAGGFWLYRRQLRGLDLGWNEWLLPALRALAILLIALTLAEPTIESRWREGEPTRLQFCIDGSRSMSISNRFERATQLLSGPQGLLNLLQDRFDITVERFSDSGLVELWKSDSSRAPEVDSLAYDWGPESWGESSPIGDVLANLVTNQGSDNSNSPSTAEGAKRRDQSIVLLTDGQSNAGRPPSEVVRQLREQGVSLYAIGFAPFDESADLAVRQFTLPERLYRTDTLSGQVTVAQTLAEGTSFTVQIEHAGAIAWSENFTATAEPQRTIEFTMPMAPLFDHAVSQLPLQTEVSRLPMKLTARLVAEGGDANDLNNTRDGHLLVASQKSRVLLVDGRSRWETRYLKNMFSRDPAWQLDSVILSSASSEDATAKRLPESKSDLLEYDLVILGEVPPGLLSSQWIEWLREFVERSSGGLIFVDGARGHLRDSYYSELHRLLPVKWLGTNGDPNFRLRAAMKKYPQLTPAGQALDALRLSSSSSHESHRLWESLPPLEFVSIVEPLPGAEVLVEAANEVDRFPLLVTERYGAGRVLYTASDETWHWRYKRAELLHSRLWLQLARWTMKVPMSLRSEFLSLDSGTASYLPTESVNVRCQLRQADGSPAGGREATAHVYSGMRVVASVPLTEQSVEGTYAAQVAPLPPGDYSVRVAASNFSTQALNLQSEFSVIEPNSEEMQRLACNTQELQNWAEQTGGQYLPEERAAELQELLEPLVRVKMQSSAMLLWQSYWWFTAAMLLLVVEWFIRKRIGLV